MALVERWRSDPLPHKRVPVVIEDKANGPAIVSELRGLVPGLVAWNPGQDSKEPRAVCQPDRRIGRLAAA